MSRDHRKLQAFELADRLAIEVYRISRGFPKEEMFGLTSQLRRATSSVPTNIVEGCARRSQQEYLNFLNIAFGSLRETGYLLTLAFRLGYMDKPTSEQLLELYDHSARVLNNLITSLSGDS